MMTRRKIIWQQQQQQQRIVMIILVLVLLISTLTESTSTTTVSTCVKKFDIWVYHSFDACESYQPPDGIGSIIADGQCHQSEIGTLITNRTDTYNLFPGYYRAICTTLDDGQQAIEFLDSGCSDSNCSSSNATKSTTSVTNSSTDFIATSRSSSLSTTSSNNSTTTTTTNNSVCTHNGTIASTLYSQTSNNIFPLQQIQSTDVSSKSSNGNDRLFVCSRIRGSNTNTTVTFTIFGDCSAPVPCPKANSNQQQTIKTYSPVSSPPSNLTTAAVVSSSSSRIQQMLYPILIVVGLHIVLV